MLTDDYYAKMTIESAAEIAERIKFSLRYPDERDAMDTLLFLAVEELKKKDPGWQP